MSRSYDVTEYLEVVGFSCALIARSDVTERKTVHSRTHSRRCEHEVPIGSKRNATSVSSFDGSTMGAALGLTRALPKTPQIP